MSSDEWLFQHDGMLYGPVAAEVLFEKIEAGAVGVDTPVAREGEPFRRMADEPVFAVRAARAAARLRVEAQARAQAEARRRRRIAWIASLFVGAVILAGGAVRFVLWAEETGLFAPDAAALAALEIDASLPVIRVELQPPGAEEEELLSYLDAEEKAGRRKGARRTTAARSAPRTSTDPDGLATEARYDQAAIQQVLAREQRSLHACLQQHVQREPGFRGEVPITFTIGNDGRVGRLWIDRVGVHEGPLYDCFRAKMAAWRFPPFAGERPSVSLAFRVGS